MTLSSSAPPPTPRLSRRAPAPGCSGEGQRRIHPGAPGSSFAASRRGAASSSSWLSSSYARPACSATRSRRSRSSRATSSRRGSTSGGRGGCRRRARGRARRLPPLDYAGRSLGRRDPQGQRRRPLAPPLRTHRRRSGRRTRELAPSSMGRGGIRWQALGQGRGRHEGRARRVPTSRQRARRGLRRPAG